MREGYVDTDLRVIALSGMAMLGVTACGNAGDSPAKTPLQPLRESVPKPDVADGDRWEYETTGGDAPARWSIEVKATHAEGRFDALLRAPALLTPSPSTDSLVSYDGPWNPQQPAPAQGLTYLQFPLQDGKRWTSVTVGPGEMTRTLVQQVKGRQTVTVAGAPIDCVRGDGTETTTPTGTPSAAISVPMTFWYCPSLRAVGRAEMAIPLGPRVVHALVTFQSGR